VALALVVGAACVSKSRALGCRLTNSRARLPFTFTMTPALVYYGAAELRGTKSMADTDSDVITRLRASLSEVRTHPDEVLLQTALNEAWFSNTLAWLLNPRGSHGLGVDFCKQFVALIARRRSEGSNGVKYARRATFLKWDKEGAGVGATGFGFRNAAVLREYYLSRPIDRRAESRGGFCDVVFLDLDTDDSFFLAIENKLFMSDHSEQLESYRAAIDEKYARASVRELVYLTLRGEEPINAGQRDLTHWIRLSWTDDVLRVLQELTSTEGVHHPQVAALISVLDWLEFLTDLNRIPLADRVLFRKRLLRAAAECMFEELTRLDAPDGGEWTLEPSSGSSERIGYSVRTASYLSLQLLPGLAVTVQGRHHSGKAEFDKIVVPFGAHPDQVMNLLDIAARDIYHKFFASHEPYLGGARRLRTSTTDMEIKHRPVFQFVHEHRFALKPILLQSAHVRQAVGVHDEEAAEAQ
jgi:hypothetical protein